MPGKEWKLLYN